MLGLVPQDLDDFGDILERVDALGFLVCDDSDPEMIDAVRADELYALRSVWFVNKRTASC